jgi:hypothetical protein
MTGTVRATVSGSGVPALRLGPGEALLLGRSAEPGVAAMPLPDSAEHAAGVLGEVVVGAEVVRLDWYADVPAQLSSLFEAPGGARRVTLAAGMSAMLDGGENHLRLLRGRRVDPDTYADLLLVIRVAETRPARRAVPPGPAAAAAPGLPAGQREWYVALALAEPWLAGADDYPRPPSNREIYERVLGWHGYAWNLRAPQRVDDAIRAVARVAFGRQLDPFESGSGSRSSNARFAVGRRAAEVQLVTPADLAAVDRAASHARPRVAG